MKLQALTTTAAVVLGIALLFSHSGCVKDNILADEDDERAWDGSKSRDFIVFDRISPDSRYDIWSVDSDGKHYKNRTKTPDINERYAVVSHDSYHFAYVADNTIYTDHMMGGSKTALPSAAFRAGAFIPRHLSFSSKSNYLTFDDQSTDPAVYFTWTDLNDITDEVFVRGFGLPAEGTVHYASFCPDDNRVCFVREHAGQFSLVVSSNEGYTDTNSVKVIHTSTARIQSPRWSHDGNWITFAKGGDNGYDVCRVGEFGGEVENLTNGGGDHRNPSFSGDDSRIVTSAMRDGLQWDLYIIDLNNSNSVSNLTATPEVNEHNPFWN